MSKELSKILAGWEAYAFSTNLEERNGDLCQAIKEIAQAAANKAAEEGDLPELPEASHVADSGYGDPITAYTFQDMRKYARIAIAADRAARNDDDEAVATVSRSNTDDSLTFNPLRDFSVTDGMKLYDRAARPVANKAEVESAAPVGAVPSIDTPEFCDLITESHCAMDEVGNEARGKTWAALIAHIDQHVASQVLAATTGASTVLTDEGITDTALQHSAGSMDGHWCFKNKNLLDFAREVAAQAGQVAVPEAVDGVRWDLFPGYLIDHCEGDLLYEEGLQHALSRMLKDPQYLAAIAATPSPASESLRSPQEAAGTEKGARDVE